jgi:hypothetical protein
MTHTQPSSTKRATLTATQQRRLKSYQKQSGLMAVMDGHTLLEPVSAIAGVPGRWDRDEQLARFIACNYEPAEPSWNATTMKATLIPEAQATNQATVDALLAKLPANGPQARVRALLEFGWSMGARALLTAIKRATTGLLSADEQERLRNCIWNLRDLFIYAVRPLRVYNLDRPRVATTNV